MKELKPAQAGTLESNDIMITVAPGAQGSGVSLELESIVFAQYGQAIRKTITAVIAEQTLLMYTLRLWTGGLWTAQSGPGQWPPWPGPAL